MINEEIKEELIKRYKFIYENTLFILAPYMEEMENTEYKSLDVKTFIYLKTLPIELLLLIEFFLLSDIKMEESSLYRFIEIHKNDNEYLKQYKKGLELLERKNQRYEYEKLKLNLDCFYLLKLLYEFISKQTGDIKNKNNKLLVIDEYIRINRYKNDGKIWTSGMYQTFNDIDNYTNYNYSVIMFRNSKKFMRDKDGVGLKSSLFIKYISNMKNHYEYNCSILTEEEKQKIYLEYHDELPCDLEVKCDLEKFDTSIQCEKRLIRPDNTKPCLEFFNINEEDIFVDLNSKWHRYYQVCPHCGFIVNIPDNILSEGIKKRIEDRCKADPMLFRKMYLYSELYSLDKNAKQGQKRILKK